jgi:hypothetical protein
LYEQPAGQLSGVYLATSTDGVHFREVGPVIEKKGDAAWLGSGSVLRAGGNFVMNFSEARSHQSIFFAQSDDLIRWTRLGDAYRSDPDPRWYEVDRWDGIWPLPRKEGGFWGYLSANPWRRSDARPNGLTCRSTGMLESDDGLRWRAVAPPAFEWGDVPQMGNVEVGAVRQFGNRYYMMVQTWGPYAGGTFLGCTAPGVYTFVADTPRGPFRPDRQAFRLLGNTRTRSTHFPRFYETPSDVLVNHFLFTRSLKAWLAPLKKAVVDDAGHLRLDYWQGNEAIKGKPIAVQPPAVVPWRVDGRQGLTASLLGNTFDLAEGFIMEGTLQWQPSGLSPGRCGVYLEETPAQGTALLLATDSKTQLGVLKRQGTTAFEPDDFVEAGIAVGRKHSFRLLVRQFMIEFYLDDRLVQCYSLPERATGRIGVVADGGAAVVEGLKGWGMTFAAAPVPPHH